ncbi:MAG TPA: transglycosylase SLT domain-containing protein [Paraburkholderia sp.]|nr:transglycosylase SLT domain-containing protein [Paraburkholderia sp.]
MPPFFPPPQIQDALNAAAKATGIPNTLLMAVAFAESSFNPAAIGPERDGQHAVGLMQLMPATLDKYQVSAPFDAAQSALGGARYLQQLAKGIGWKPSDLVAAYVWGPAKYLDARKTGKVWPKDVTDHVRKVLAAQHYYRTQAPPPTGLLVSVLGAAIDRLNELNAEHAPARALYTRWHVIHPSIADLPDEHAALNANVKSLWQEYATVYERAPITDQTVPYPSKIEPDFWRQAGKKVDAGIKAVKKIATEAAYGIGSAVFLAALFLMAVASDRRR